MNTEAEAEWLTIGEAATLLGVSIVTLRRWDESGKLTATRIGGVRTYRRTDIEALAAGSDGAA